jgi:hypothetical protein
LRSTGLRSIGLKSTGLKSRAAVLLAPLVKNSGLDIVAGAAAAATMWRPCGAADSAAAATSAPGATFPLDTTGGASPTAAAAEAQFETFHGLVIEGSMFDADSWGAGYGGDVGSRRTVCRRLGRWGAAVVPAVGAWTPCGVCKSSSKKRSDRSANGSQIYCELRLIEILKAPIKKVEISPRVTKHGLFCFWFFSALSRGGYAPTAFPGASSTQVST